MTIQANDFRSNTLTGSITVDGGSFALTLQTNRLVLEGDKSFVVKFRKDNPEGILVATTPTITITDNTSVNAFYANVGTIEEGDYVNFTLETSNVPNNYAMFYTIANVSGDLNSEDVSPFSGTAYIIGNAANITILATADLSNYADDNESFEIKLRSESTSGDIVATSNTVSILDTSNSARITGISITRNTALSSPYLYEGETLYANISTINGDGASAATFYYSISGNASVYGSNTGSFVINDNEGSFIITLETDVVDTEQKTLAIQLRRNSTTGTVLDTTNTYISTNYSSGIYYGVISRIDNIYPNVTTGYGEDSFLFTVDTINSYENETLYYKTSGNASVQSGSFTVSGNTATISITSENNTVPKTMGLDVYRDSNHTKLLGQSNSEIYFIPNLPQFLSVSPFNESIIETERFDITVNTLYGRPGTGNLYYTVSANGDIASATSGSFDPASNLFILPETNIPDGENREFQFTIRTISTSGTIQYTSNLLTVESYTNQPNVVPVVSSVNSVSPNVNLMSATSDSVGFTISTTGGYNGETLYYITTGNLLQSESSTDLSGSFNLTSNTGLVVITTNGTASSDRTFGLEVRRGSNTGTLLNTSSSNVDVSTYTGPVVATGGTIEDSGGYRKHIFTTGDTLSITQGTLTPSKSTLEFFAVGGGGGGGSTGYGGGGGGGGGFITGTVNIKGKQGSFVANVGGGGGGNQNGGNTDILSLSTNIFAYGGGGAGGLDGGSGGGMNNYVAPGITTLPGGTALQPSIGGYGYAGGAAYMQQGAYPTGQRGSAGGGGGAGGVGESATSTTDTVKNGGAGRAGPLSPSSYGGNNAQMSYPNPAPATTPTGGTRYFAGGGGGSAEQGVTCSSLGGSGGGGAANPSASYPNPAGGGGGRSGIATSGGGGGGGAHGPAPGGSGGSGILIIRYPYP